MVNELSKIMLKILPIHALRPHEEFDRDHARKLSNEIANTGFWSSPIVCDAESQIIMDGHHRFASAQLLGLKYIPCFCIPYDKKYVSVETWRESEKITVQDILTCVKENRLMPQKSTKHLLTIPLIKSHIPLSILR